MLLITASDVHMHTQHISGSLLATKTKHCLTDTSLFQKPQNTSLLDKIAYKINISHQMKM